MLVRHAVLLLPMLFGCHREQHFESVCQITRKAVVETDQTGTATEVDLELEWDPCPGQQVQMIRGGADFARCIERVKIGDYVPVKVSHFWDSRGFWDWDLYEIAGCARPIELESPGSFEKSQECHDVSAHGHVVGFTCDRRPVARLVKICPWMARD